MDDIKPINIDDPERFDILDFDDLLDPVDFNIKVDQIRNGKRPEGSEASQKKCPFCS